MRNLRATERVWDFPFGAGRVVVRPDLNDLYILNSSASYAWNLLDSGKDQTQATRDFAAHFSIPLETAARDLQNTWTEWAQGLLASPSPAPIGPSPPVPPDDLGADAFCRTYFLHGKNVRVILHHADLIDEIVPRLESLPFSSAPEPDATLRATASDAGYHVFSGGACVATEQYAANARVVFLLELVHAAAVNSPWTAILHAGACGTESKCVIFPAETHSGKTTLAAVLMTSGLTFYADDSVALETDTFKVPAMPFAMMIRENSWPVIAKYIPVLETLPTYDRNGDRVKFLHPTGQRAEEGAQPTAMVFSRWQPNVTTAINSLSSFEALVRLRDTGFWVAPDRECIGNFLAWIESLPIFELIYSDVEEARDLIRTMCKSAAPLL